MTAPDITVVLLCHNEKENLPTVLSGVDRVLRGLGTAEILVIDDGSHDGTEAWLQAGVAGIVAPIRVERHSRRRGYGAAVRSGLRCATGKMVVYMDGDGQYDPEQISAMLLTQSRHGCDVVAGIRTNRHDPAHRRFIGAAYNGAVRLALRLEQRDVDCGFRLLTQRAVRELEPLVTLDGNLIGPELLLKAAQCGLVVQQIPVHHRPRQFGVAKGADLFAILGAVKETSRVLADLWLKSRR